jgi:26S proteasome regulatory subunit T4
MDPVREKALQDYRKKLLEHAEVEGRLKESMKLTLWHNFDIACIFHCILTVALLCLVREQLKELTKQYDKSENDLKALQSVGQVNL